MFGSVPVEFVFVSCSLYYEKVNKLDVVAFDWTWEESLDLSLEHFMQSSQHMYGL